MRFHTALCVLLLGGAALACGGGGSGSSSDWAFEVDLTAPWIDMQLPTSDAIVTFSDATTVVINHEGGKVADLTAEYDQAIIADGWSEAFKTVDANSASVSYSKGDAQLFLSVVDSMGSILVSVSKA